LILAIRSEVNIYVRQKPSDVAEFLDADGEWWTDQMSPMFGNAVRDQRILAGIL
jgi:hypothetical protein